MPPKPLPASRTNLRVTKPPWRSKIPTNTGHQALRGVAGSHPPSDRTKPNPNVTKTPAGKPNKPRGHQLPPWRSRIPTNPGHQLPPWRSKIPTNPGHELPPWRSGISGHSSVFKRCFASQCRGWLWPSSRSRLAARASSVGSRAGPFRAPSTKLEIGGDGTPAQSITRHQIPNVSGPPTLKTWRQNAPHPPRQHPPTPALPNHPGTPQDRNPNATKTSAGKPKRPRGHQPPVGVAGLPRTLVTKPQ